MRVLALDASNKYFSVAVEIDGKIVAESVSETADSHNEKLSDAISLTLKAAKITARDLSLVVVGQGPGSFTGLRIGYGLASGICTSLKIPFYSYSSFAAAAVINRDKPTVLVTSDARREEFFYALFSGDFSEKTRIATNKEIEAMIRDSNPFLVRLDLQPLPLARGLCLLRGILGANIATDPDYVRAVSARTIAERGS